MSASPENRDLTFDQEMRVLEEGSLRSDIQHAIIRRDEGKTYNEIPLETIGTLADLIVELLTSFSPYLTAFEAKCPWSSDGEDLALRMKEVLGLPADWDEEPKRT